MYFPEVVIKMLIIKNFTVYPSHLIIFATNPGFPIRKTLTIPGRQLCGLNKGDEGLSSQLLQLFKYLQGTSFISVTYIAT